MTVNILLSKRLIPVITILGISVCQEIRFIYTYRLFKLSVNFLEVLNK